MLWRLLHCDEKAAYQRRYREENREEIQKREKLRYLKKHPFRFRFIASPEQLKARQRKRRRFYETDHREHFRRKYRERYRKDPCRYMAKRFFNKAGLSITDIPKELLAAKIIQLKTKRVCTRMNKGTSSIRNLSR